MTVLRRLDAELETTKQAVLEMKASLDAAGIVNQDVALRQAAGQAFYNTSQYTLKDLRNRASQQQLRADFEDYLNGFSSNVQDILENFEFCNQIPRLSKADALGTLIEKLLSPEINLSPTPVLNGDGSVKQPGLDNHAMGTIFEELVRRFNEENNEEAGEHWTPRDAVKLMANLIFLPIAEQITSGTYLLYDGACGTGGMLTVAEETLQALAKARGKQVSTYLYGQEINAETAAIAKADLLLKGEGEAADNIVGGPEHSTLASDGFSAREFDFMLSNPPYGKSWKGDLERMGGKKEMRDLRFVTDHAGAGDYSLVTRSSDGQMMFLANMLSKIFPNEAFGYWKVTVERPLRLSVTLDKETCARFREACEAVKEGPLANLINQAREAMGEKGERDYNAFSLALSELADESGVRLTAKRKKLLQDELAQKDEAAVPVIKKSYKAGKVVADALYGLYEVVLNGKACVVE